MQKNRQKTSNWAPGRRSEQAEILPAELLERTILLDERVATGGEHAEQQRRLRRVARLRRRAAGERRRARGTPTARAASLAPASCRT